MRGSLLFLIALGSLAMLLGPRLSEAQPAASERDPSWSVAGELSRPRAYARAVAVETGEILVFGGLDPKDPDVTVTTSELFDTDSGRSTVLKQHLLGRLNQGVAVTSAGRVVVTGGTEWLGDGWNSVADVDVYLPWSRTWLAAPGMSQARSDHGTTVLRDGRVLVTGGNYNNRVLRTSELFDPLENEWTKAAQLPLGRTQFSIATLPDGSVLAAGGFDEYGVMTTTTFIYEPWRDKWMHGPEMREVRLNHSTVRLPDGDLLFFGGERMGGGTAERYSWRDRRFVYAGVLGEPRLVAQGAALPDGRVIAVGGLPEVRGRRSFDPTRDAELWDPAKTVWRDISDAPTKRAYAQIVVMDDGIYRVSGIGEGEKPFATVEELTWN